MRKFFIFCLLFFLPFFTFAEKELKAKEEILEADFQAVITAPSYIPVTKSVLFDASESIYFSEEKEGKVKFFWDFHNEEGLKTGKEQVFSFKYTGIKKVTLTMVQGERKISTEKEFVAYNKKITLLTEEGQNLYEKKEIKKQASEAGAFLEVYEISLNQVDFISDDNILKQLVDWKDFLKDSDIIIFDTPHFDILPVFTQFIKTQDTNFNLNNKKLIKFFRGDLSFQKQLVNRYRELLGIKSIFLTRKEALHPLFAYTNQKSLLSVLEERGIEYLEIDNSFKISKIFLVSQLINYFLAEGVPANTLYLILAFPFIACLVVFFRQFMGISTFGVYLPIMIALALFVLGFQIGAFTLGLIFSLGISIRLMFGKVEMLYIPRVATMLSLIALSFLFIIFLMIKFDSLALITYAVFPMLLSTTLSERFVSAQSQEGLKGAIIGVIETLIVALISYELLSIVFLRNLILAFPEVIILPLILIVILGKFSGLRLTEYFKFRSLFTESIEE